MANLGAWAAAVPYLGESMPKLLVTRVDPTDVLGLLHALEAAQADTVVDARATDEDGDGSFAGLASILGAAGFGYLRRGRSFSGTPDGIDGAVGELAELCRDGNNVVVLIPPEHQELLEKLALTAFELGCRLGHLTPAGEEPHRDRLSFD